MTTLTRCALRRPHELPPVLTTHEVEGVLTGSLTPPNPSEPRAAREVREVREPTRRETSALPHDAYPDPYFSPQPTSTADLPDARVWVSRFAVAMLECLEGHRAPMQLAKHVHPEVLARLSRRYRTALRRGKRAGVTCIKRVRVSQPRDGVTEAALVTRIGGRPTPIALRMCGVDGRWVVTVLEMI